MLQLIYDSNLQIVDIERDGLLANTELLNTAVFISLFTNRLASPDDTLPDPNSDRGGYWADAYPDVEGDLIGSKLWLLRRSKATPATLNLAKNYVEEALQWLIEDGIAESVVATVERAKATKHPQLISVGDALSIRVEITKPGRPAEKWAGVWQAHMELL